MFDPVPVVPVVIGKDITDLIVEIPSLKFGVFALDGRVAGSALFKISVGDVVFQFDSGIFADRSEGFFLKASFQKASLADWLIWAQVRFWKFRRAISSDS